ncbi:MAG: hypothetical protein MUP76_10930 [Acidimicrobiia bacterium]|nr:hypothetical protein [Acidimicrobiia bacterium]
MILHPVLAHSWGWDEVLYFAIPVVLALLWIRWIEVRACNRKLDAGAETAADREEPANG